MTTLYIIANSAEAAERHAMATPDIWFTDAATAFGWLDTFEPQSVQGFTVYEVRPLVTQDGATFAARLFERAGEIAACFTLVIGGMWACGALSLIERAA